MLIASRGGECRAVLSAIVLLVTFGTDVTAKASPITRREGFLLIWRSIQRTVEATREKPFADLKGGEVGLQEITFAKARGLFDEPNFDTDDDTLRLRPDDALLRETALLWLLRTRSLEPIDAEGRTKLTKTVERPDVPLLASRYELKSDDLLEGVSSGELLAIMRALDQSLASETHEVSLYSEKFHGRETAFGETFNMHALTAAHRTFPRNTLVRVTNVENGMTVDVRINDRGPYVQGRDMDLSLAAFTKIADRSKGKIMARFERLGDALLLNRCNDTRFQRRVGRSVRLRPGVPHFLALGREVRFTADQFYVVRSVTYPDGLRPAYERWISPDEDFSFTPSVVGKYIFTIGDKFGRRRGMEMEVVECEETG